MIAQVQKQARLPGAAEARQPLATNLVEGGFKGQIYYEKR
jgi:hypothetical protein